MKKVVSSVVVVLLVYSVGYAAPLLTADDFNPPVQAPEEQREELLTVQNPENVKTETDPVLNVPVTKAANVQDAINTIAQRQEADSKMIDIPSGGYGFVATGIGSYRKDMPNLTARRISQRNAYVQALMQAKLQMSGQVEGLALEGFTNFDQQVIASDTDNEALRSSTSQSAESVRGAAAAVLKGYVTYSVYDDFNNGLVYVTIVSTPKTRQAFSRVTANTVDSKTLNEGLNAVLAEIQSGLVPMVGGRVVEVPSTGEVAFVGFGSAVVRQTKNPALRSQMLRVAQNSANLRASDALCGIIIGDNTRGESRLDEQTQEAMTSYENMMASDPMNALATSEDIAEAEQAQNEFRNDMQFSQTIESARKGTLPPGVRNRAWLDDEGAFAYAVAVYIPSMTKAAISGAKEMKDTQMVPSVNPDGTRSISSPKDEAEPSRPDYKDSGELKRTPSGTIKQPL